MATQDDRPGLLSKVAMFVRNPTKDWSELDQQRDSDSSGYDKQALKAMIERKRQNDFVRKREFDQLRKLRNRDPGTLASLAHPSFFQNSLPTDMDGRAVTLRKIDEIEAQMSRQWWKAKADGETLPFTQPQSEMGSSIQQSSAETHVSQHPESNSGLALSFASTLPFDAHQDAASLHADEFQPTLMASEMHSVPGADAAVQDDVRPDARAGFSTSRLFAIEVDEMATDPELEEAAIRFANSDDAGAESGLLAALRGDDLAPHAAQSWATALLDFYRATQRAAAFEAAADEFALHLDGVQPIWCGLGSAESAAVTSGPQTPIWDCPATLTAQGMESLRLAMVSKPMPWHLNWNELVQVAPDAWALVDGLFASLCEEEVSLRFDGAQRVTNALRALTPSGDNKVNPLCWNMRLNALRAMRLQDDFDLAGLDYCVTFGAAPPVWVYACCRIAMPEFAVAGTGADALTHAGGMQVGASEGAPPLLQGEVLGDVSPTLAALDAAQLGGKRMLIDCSHLIRVDFAAAGSILNWVAMRQAEGKRVQFQNVQRLVAAFFNVIGINEHAKVIPRPF